MPVTLQSLRFETLRIPFKVAFRHASAERAETSTVWVEARAEDGPAGIGESCPRPYVTGETIDSARSFFDRHQASIYREVGDLAALRAWAAAHAADIDANPAAWCAIELALLDVFGKAAGVGVETLLGVPPLDGQFRYTAVLGDMGVDAFRAMASQYLKLGFTDFKIKLSGDLERDRAKIGVLRSGLDRTFRVRADANNLWPGADEAVSFLRQLDFPFFALEEPVRANDYDGLRRVGEALHTKIILDESFRGFGQPRDRQSWDEALASWQSWDEALASWQKWDQAFASLILNIRVSKMGGLLRSLAVVNHARTMGTPVIVGAQVGETSVLTRAALTVAHAARDILIAQEGAFGTFLLERDACSPTLMFGAGGILDVAAYPELAQPGLGLTPVAP